MEKLRERFMYYAGLLAAMKGCGMLAPVEDDTIAEDLSHISHLLDAEEQGLLLRLPCKVGDRIYFIDDGEIYWDSVNVIELRKEKGEFVFCIGFMDYRKDDFGKIVFPTKAEAEKKLAEMWCEQ